MLMKHLNLELAKLEKRVAPGLALPGLLNLCGGGGGGGTSNGSSGSCDGTSASGKSSKSKSHDSCSS